MKSDPLRLLSYESNNLFSLLTNTHFTTGLTNMQLLCSTSGNQKTIKWFILIQITIYKSECLLVINSLNSFKKYSQE